MKKHHFHIIVVAFLAVGLTACGKKVSETQPIKKDVTETVFASGSLKAKGWYQLKAQTTGYLATVNFESGDLVKKDQVLAIIQNTENFINADGAQKLYNIAVQNANPESPQLKQAKYNIEINKEKLEQDQRTEQRYKKLLESNSISKVEYENALLNLTISQKNYESALENYNNLQINANQQVVNNRTSKDVYAEMSDKNEIKALTTGKIYKKLKEPGDYVRQGDVIAEIGSADELYAEINIDESNISRIEIGQPVTIQINTIEDKVFLGSISEIKPSFDEASQSFICDVNFDEPLHYKIINTQLQTNITVGEQKNALLIPRNYIDFAGYVQVKGEKEKTKVKTQFVSNEWVQVIEGIDETVTLITDDLPENK
ncbi:MAG: HlyD family efflux transporter periplasmic adaptor subunit [Flavobacteriales bacterium]|nr:HlyD family efflux transporter periplasmic adaptor subunit [Flavobacteriales bacterium]